jgi:hypothetical protein
MGKADRRQSGLAEVRSFVGGVYGEDLHAKRIASLAGATLGVMQAASLAVAMIGQALAQARGLVTKHAIKQVDRLLSNHGIDVWESFARWVPHQIGTRQEVLVAMDWTDFDHDDQATLVLSLVTGHGRAAPLLWISVWKDELTKQRNDFEDACLRRLADLIPPGCRVTSLADRGFGDQKLFAFLAELGFGYVIRSVATSTSQMLMGKPGPLRHGWARADAPASCSMRASPPRGSRSARSSASTPGT